MTCNCYNNNNTQDDLRLVRGNDFATLHDIFPKYPDGTSVEDFDLADVTDLTILVKRNNGSPKDVSVYCESNSITAPKQIRIDWDGLKMGIGSYRFDFSGKFQGRDWRCYSADKGFGIVESNEEANIPADTIIADGVYQILTDFTMTYQTQEQADWEEVDNTLPSYIKNKPTIPSAFSELEDDSEHRTVTDSEKTAWNAKYDKPSSGIPKSDMSSSVQQSLAKADTALQNETDPTVPEWAKSPTKPSYTASEVGALPSTTSIPSTLAELDDDANHRTVSDAEKTAWNNKESTSNKVTSLSSSSTDTQYPSAKCVYDIVGNVETLLAAL